MINREKVIKGLDCHVNQLTCHECPYVDATHPGWGCHLEELIADALALLKKQEPIKPTLSVDTWVCSKCGHTLESQELIDDEENPQVLIHEQYEYCPNCGKKVKWE